MEEPGGPDGSKVQTSRGKSCQRDSELNVTRSDAFVFGAAHKGGHGGGVKEGRGRGVTKRLREIEAFTHSELTCRSCSFTETVQPQDVLYI